VQLMQAEPWAEFWRDLGLIHRRFEDVGLSRTSSDLEIWQRCQTEELILITDNRNDDSPESLEAVIRENNTPDSLPVFTIADVKEFGRSQSYAEHVLISLYEYLLRIDSVRGTGRLYLP
jgi:hypothetical protein